MAGQALLERSDELSRIDAALERSGLALLLEGPAGIGKSTLIDEARVRGRARGMEVLSARGGELETGFGFGVARQLFERRIVAPDRERLLDGAARLGLPALEAVDAPVRDPHSVLHGLHWLAANLAADRPLLITVDDAQWADLPSLQWLAYTARRLEGLPVVLTIAVRTSDANAGAAPLEAVRAEASTVRLRPGPLSVAGVERLVDGEPAFSRACHEATAGNPYLLRELVRAVERDGIPRTAAAVERIRALAPETISRSVLIRLARLAPPARRVATAVAILEPHAELRHVTALTGLTESEVLAAVDTLHAAAILAAGRPLAFAHPIMRAALLADLPPGEHAATQARAARALGDNGAAPELVATHLAHVEPSGDRWAVEVLMAAAAQAQARGAVQTAVLHLERAVAEPPPPELRAGALTFLGALEIAAQRPAAVAHLEEAVRGATTATERALASLTLAQAQMVAGDPQAAQRVLTVAVAQAGVPPELRLAVDAYLLAAQVNGRTPPGLDERLERLGDELPGDTPGERLLLTHLAFCQLSLGRPAERVLPLVERSLCDGVLDLDLPDPFAANLPAQMLVFLDQLERAERLLAQGLGEARRRGLLSFFGLGSGARGILALRRGDVALAETSAADARVADAQTLGLMIAPLAALEVAVALERRAPAEARSVLERVGTPPPPLERATIVAYLHHAHGLVALDGRDWSAAVAAFERAGAVLASVGRLTPAVLAWRSDCARALAALGRTAEAIALATEELELARAFGAPRPVAIALRGLAAVSPSDAASLLAEAADVAARTEARLEHGYALAELGAALRRARRPADARERLLEALELADRCGSARLEHVAREELAVLGTRPRRTARTGYDALTPSEARVARMAADGMSNPEIAQALYIARATVESHLARSYAKLGIGSRRDLAAAVASPDKSP